MADSQFKEYKYHENTKQFVFAIAEMAKQLIAVPPESKLIPIIMIDGPAGTGKSTFTADLINRLREIGMTPGPLEQDAFGVYRGVRKKYKINPCSDLARDPQTIVKLKELMETGKTKVPHYDKTTGVRTKDAVELKANQVIVYEGVSSLSAVIFENPAFDAIHQQAVPIKIFFQPDNEVTLYHSRQKRDVEERGVDLILFDDNWHDYQRNNWLYTMRGITNANFVVTRDRENHFTVVYANPVIYSSKPILSPIFEVLPTTEQQQFKNQLIKKT